MYFEQPLALCEPNIGKREEKAVLSAMRSGWVSTAGPDVGRFEEAIAITSDTTSACAVAAGTMGLQLALLAVGVTQGDLVICPSYSFIASANAISHAGATPFFVDIDPLTWTLDVEKLHELLERSFTRDNIYKATGQRLSAIVPVYTFGTPADMDKLKTLAQCRNLPLVADAAAAIGARYKKRPLGNLADLTVYSFNGNKTITSGGGGAVVGRSDLVDKVRHLASCARVNLNYEHDAVGFNYRITNIEAALGAAQLARLPEFLQKKRMIRDFYAAHLPFPSFPEPDYACSALWFSGIVVDDATPLCAQLNKANLLARPFWQPLHWQLPYRFAPRTAMPVTDEIWRKILVLPSSTTLSTRTLGRIVRAVKECV
jgi:perosamine synthetase